MLKRARGAVLCRAAPSFLRFGSFELPARRGDVELVRKLADYCLLHLGSHFELKEINNEEEGQKYANQDQSQVGYPDQYVGLLVAIVQVRFETMPGDMFIESKKSLQQRCLRGVIFCDSTPPGGLFYRQHMARDQIPRTTLSISEVSLAACLVQHCFKLKSDRSLSLHLFRSAYGRCQRFGCRRQREWWPVGRHWDFATVFSTPTTLLCSALASILGLAGKQVCQHTYLRVCSWRWVCHRLPQYRVLVHSTLYKRPG